MKKLLIFTDTIDPRVDGAAIFLRNIVPYLSNHYEVTIIAPNYGDVSYDHVTLVQFPILKFGSTEYGIPKISRKIIKREVKKCDVIFNQESLTPITASFFGIRYARKYKKPFFTYTHAIDWESMPEYAIPELPGISWLLRRIAAAIIKIYGQWFLRRSSGIIVPFPTVGKILQKNDIHGRFETVPVGVLDEFQPGKSTVSFPNTLVIGYVGRLSREKCLGDLLQAFEKLRTKYEKLLLLIVGDGPEKTMFEGKKNVQITGFIQQKDVVQYLRAMDIYVLPSISETSSIATLEAMRTGVCCITRDVGCIRDYLQPGYNGFFFRTEQELETVLETLLNDEKLRNTIRKNASDSVAPYTWKHTTDCLMKIIDNCV